MLLLWSVQIVQQSAVGHADDLLGISPVLGRGPVAYAAIAVKHYEARHPELFENGVRQRDALLAISLDHDDSAHVERILAQRAAFQDGLIGGALDENDGVGEQRLWQPLEKYA